VLTLFTELYRSAVAAGGILDRGEQPAVYMIAALNHAYIISSTLGNEYGLELPQPEDFARFCLQGLGAEVDDAWYHRVGQLVHLPRGPISTPRGASGQAHAETEIA
jgi:hypothetical protein